MSKTSSVPVSFLPQVLPYFVLVAAAAFTMAMVVVNYFDVALSSVGLELVKSLVQVTSVLLLGQVITIIVKDREIGREHALQQAATERSRAEALGSLRAELLLKLSRAFVSVKGSRRLLRAEALSKPWVGDVDADALVLKDPYVKHMQAVNLAELELESLWHQLDALNTSSVERHALVANVAAMKDYLRELLFQFEQVVPQFDRDTGFLAIARFVDNAKYGTLLDFVDASNHTQFKRRFVLPFREATGVLRAALLG